MKNKIKAIYDVFGCVMEGNLAQRFFYNVYEFLLYNDTESFLKTLDYRKNIAEKNKSAEEYHVFKYMLQLLKQKYPHKIKTLSPHLLPCT